MPVLSLKVIASLLQLHGPGATIKSDHPGIDALLNGVRDQTAQPGSEDQGNLDQATIIHDSEATTPPPTQVWFRRAFGRGGPGIGGFRRGFGRGGPFFRRGFGRAY